MFASFSAGIIVARASLTTSLPLYAIVPMAAIGGIACSSPVFAVGLVISGLASARGKAFPARRRSRPVGTTLGPLPPQKLDMTEMHGVHVEP